MKGMYDSFNSTERSTSTTISDCRSMVILMSKSTQPHQGNMTKQELSAYSYSVQLILQHNSVAMTNSISSLLEMITTITISARGQVLRRRNSYRVFRRMARTFILSREPELYLSQTEIMIKNRFDTPVTV
jgi:hypothetical protein